MGEVAIGSCSYCDKSYANIDAGEMDDGDTDQVLFRQRLISKHPDYYKVMDIFTLDINLK